MRSNGGLDPLSEFAESQRREAIRSFRDAGGEGLLGAL